MKIPIRLRKEPLIEAVWEIRFSSTKKSIADLLPGLVFKSLPDKYPNIVRLPIADIPTPIIENDPNLRYAPKIRLEGDNHAVQIGENVVALSCRRPYSGWSTFSSDIRELANMVKETELIDTLERFSLKYIDLIVLSQPPDINCLNLELKVGEYNANGHPVQLRTEIKEDDLIHIIQIISPAGVSLPGESKGTTGVLLDIDSIRPLKKTESWADIDHNLDRVHLSCKRIFFSLLKEDTITKLEPEY
jgi:uncharacterized protein (TIGR04255 family)